MSELIESPCVKVCAIDPTTGWCLGCGRSMREIAGWSALPPEQRRAIVEQLAVRKAAILDRERRASGYRLPGS